MSVNSGEFVAVLGASGSGKTTLLRVLAGFLRPSMGSVIFGARTICGPHAWVPPEDRHLGIVPQEGALFPHLDVRRNVGFGLDRSTESSLRIDEVLEMVGMQDFSSARPQELSGGQQQRVALARALAPRPELLLLDEPFSALDASMRVSLRAEVRELLKSLGTTSVMVTHDQEEALSIADRVAVMRDGRLVQMATPEELYQNPADLAIARFVGDAVELPAEWSGSESIDTSLGRIAVQRCTNDAPGEIVAVFRPEQLSVVGAGSIDGSHTGSALGTVTRVSYHGHDSLVHVRLATGQDITVRVAGKAVNSPGESVRVLVNGSASIFPA
jgi:iron(III) transport system ATP-binding protein